MEAGRRLDPFWLCHSPSLWADHSSPLKVTACVFRWRLRIVEVSECMWKPHKPEDREYTVFLFESDLKTFGFTDLHYQYISNSHNILIWWLPHRVEAQKSCIVSILACGGAWTFKLLGKKNVDHVICYSFYFNCLSDTLGKGEGNSHHVGTEFQISSLVSFDS